MQERYHGVKLSTILDMEASGELYLPNFQRQFRWERSRQKKLLSSFIVGIPIGGILLLDGEGNEFASRRLCYREENRANPEEDCIYLLDGQQRVSTLKSVFHDFFHNPDEWRQEWDNLYPKLKNRWFIRLKPEEEQEDIFGLGDLIFDEETIYEKDASDVESHIVCKKMLVSEEDKWYNPQFINEELEDLKGNRNMVLQYIAEMAAPENLVPLFSIRSDDPVPLHESVVELIAERRVHQLQAAVQDGEADIVDLLEPVEPSIQNYVDNGEHQRIDQAWNRLSNRWRGAITSMLGDLVSNEIPRIRLGEDEIDRAVSIFDNMNKGGTPLSTFDLVVARAAQDRPQEESLTDQVNNLLGQDFSLPVSLTNSLISPPSDWSAEKASVLDDDTPPTKTTRKQILNLLSILNNGIGEDLGSLEVRHIKKKEHLDLSSTQINDKSDDSILALQRGLSFMQMRCGIQSINDVPYELTLIPVSYCLYHDDIWESQESIDKIEYWYWSSILSGHYREKQNPRCIEDTKILYRWLTEGGDDPFASRYDRILEVSGYSDKPMLLREIPQPDQYGVPSAVEDTILQYVLSKQPYDFLPTDLFGEQVRLSSWGFAESIEFEDNEGNAYEMEKETHHICPLSDITSIGETSNEIRNDKSHVLNSPLNLTYITKTANRTIRDKSPSKYIDFVNDISSSNHLLPPHTEFQKRGDEDDYEYYLRIVSRRYDILKSSIRDELDQLRS